MSQETLCTVDAGLADHVRELLDAAGIDSLPQVDPSGRVAITVDDTSLEHARAVIGLVLPGLLDDSPGATRLSDRLIRTEHDPPTLPGGLVDARPTYGYADPLAEPDATDGDPGTDTDDEYVPPKPPPLPRPRDRIEKAAWAGLVLGPVLLVAVQVFGLAGWLTPVALVAFFAGFGALVARMDDRPRHDDGWDDGAVV